VPSSEENRTYKHFVSSAQFTSAFPTSLAAVYAMEKKMYAEHCLADEQFGSKVVYNVPTTVFAMVVHGRVHDLQRCSDLNGKVLHVHKCETVCELATSSECTHEGQCISQIKLHVRRTNAHGQPIGEMFRIKSDNLSPMLTGNHAIGIGLLRQMSSLWRDNTAVVLQFQKQEIDIMRLATEYWANEDKLCTPSAITTVLSVTMVVDLEGFLVYMSENTDYDSERSKEVTEKVCSFVHVRTSGTNLLAECVVCMEPLRTMQQVRLGCVCVNAGSEKGRQMHLHCAQKWLLAQSNVWRSTHEWDKPAPAKGPDGPTCPICIQRVQGSVPYTTDLKASMELSIERDESLTVVKIINIEDDDTSYNLYEDLDRKAMFLDMSGEEGSVLPLTVDKSILYGIITYNKMERFPSAETLVMCSGDGTSRLAAAPGPATSFTLNDPLLAICVQKYNNQVYYAALGCWLRWKRQFGRNGLAAAVV
jgi:hypothetical protein